MTTGPSIGNLRKVPPGDATITPPWPDVVAGILAHWVDVLLVLKRVHLFVVMVLDEADPRRHRERWDDREHKAHLSHGFVRPRILG